MEIPQELKYTKNDEWIRADGTVGVTDYAQDQLSDVVYVEFVVSEGDEVKQGDVIATIESVKAAADVYAPVSGKVVAVNEALADAPEKINEDPYGEAWLIKLEIADPSELDGLMDAAAYQAYCEERE
ncbi:MAG TPA: glycine cleavage system protein GcvH [Anaerolineae bacterium]|nr:glycine cleavage system protein GcvH [Anaerolineae bacterium]HID83980.1 glycine cleavage system protein GcvH [Anaerolineales bacterium]HIQ08155.1 glycine cleavage system protein GcvH [Anaerolineaceae bacterium]